MSNDIALFGLSFATVSQTVAKPYQEIVYKTFAEANAHQPQVPCKGIFIQRDLSASNGPIDRALIALGFKAAKIFAPVAA